MIPQLHMYLRRSVVIGLVALAAIANARPAGAQTYTVRDIGPVDPNRNVDIRRINSSGQTAGLLSTPNGQLGFLSSGLAFVTFSLGGSHTDVSDLNDNGQAVGWSYLPSDSAQHAFVFGNGAIHDLNALIPANSGWTLLQATAINNAGQVVGYGRFNAQDRAFLYTPGQPATVVDLGTLGGSFSWAADVNASGQVAGYSHTSNGQQHAFLYSNGAMIDLGTLGGTNSAATALNDAGQVTGWAYTANNNSQRAFRFSGGVLSDLGTLGGQHSFPSAGINANGDVSGYAYLPSNNGYHAFIHRNGSMVDLGTLGGSYSYARAINDAGVVVGHTDNGTFQLGFRYENGPGMQDISTFLAPCSNRQLYEGVVINNSGQIAGRGYRPDIGFSFLMTPGSPGAVLTTTLYAPTVQATYNSQVTVQARLSAESCGVSNVTVSLARTGQAPQSALTNADGVAFASVSLAGLNAGTYVDGIDAQFAGSGALAASADQADLIIDKAIPFITWNAPAAIAFGTPLGSSQLSATANVSGTFTYSPPAGSILPGGTHALTAQFNANDPANYVSPVWKSVSIAVNGGQAAASLIDLGTLGGSHSEVWAMNGAGQAAGWSLDSSGQQRAFLYSNGAMTDIGSLGNGYSFPEAGINASGQVAGYSYASNAGCYHAFLYTSSITDLGTLGGSCSFAHDINDAGQVVGWASLSNNQQRAFRYSNNVMTDLGTLGGLHSVARRINASGQVIGYAQTSNGETHPFLYSNGLIDLGTFGGTHGESLHINDAGQVAGIAYTSNNAGQHAFLYSNGTMTDIGTFGGRHSYPTGINAAGHVIGYAYPVDNNYQRAFLFSNGVLTDLGTFGGRYSYANAINDAGDVVGNAETAAFNYNAFLYRNGVLINLGTLGGPYSEAISINNAGDVMGYSQTSSGQFHAFLWRSGVMTDLGTLGGSESYGRVLNAPGQVGGYAYLTNNLARHAFIATPTTAATTLAVSAVAGSYGGTATLTATLTSGSPMANRSVQFSLNGTLIGVSTTDASGEAILPGISLAGIDAGNYPSGVSVLFPGEAGYLGTVGTAALTIAKIAPTVQAVGGTFPYDGLPHPASCSVTGLNGTPLTGATAAYAPGGASGPVNAGSYVATCSYAETTNYEASSAGASITITPVAPTVTTIGGTFAYTGNPHAASCAVTGINGENLGSGSISYAPGGAIAPTNAGTVTATCSHAAAGNYTAGSDDDTITITAVAPTVTTTGGTFAYTGNPHAASCAVTGVNGESLGTGAISYAPGGATPPTNAGAYTATCSFAAAGNYSSSTDDDTITITAVAPTVTTTGGSFPYTGNPHAAACAVTGINGEDLGTGSVTYAPGGGVAPTNVGSYTATCAFPAAGNYAAATNDDTITVTAVTPTVTTTGGTFGYTGNPRTASCAVTGVNGENLGSGSITYAPGAVAPTNVGSYTATCSFAAAGNYAGASDDDTLTISAASPTVMTTGGSFVYTGNPHAATCAVTGVNGENLGTGSIAYAPGGASAPTSVGTVTATCTFAAFGNYAGGSDAKSVTITKASSTVTVTPLNAQYDGNPHPTTALVSGVGTGITQTVTWTYSGACSSAPVNVVETPCTAKATYAGDANHDGNYGSATITLTKAPQTITNLAAPAAAGMGTSFVVTATGGASGVALAFSSSGGCSNSGATFTMTSGVTACTVIVNQAGNGNYQAAPQVTQSVTAAGFTFAGFFQPIDMTVTTTVWNKANAGQAIPVKWRLTAGGAPVSSLSSFAGLYSYEVNCSSGAGEVEDAIEEYAPGNSNVTYDGDGNFHYNWKTPTTYKNKCRAMYVALSDGSMSRVAMFKFK